MNLLRLTISRLFNLLCSSLFGDGGGMLCFVTSPINDSELLDLVRALARAVAREDHRKVSFEREMEIQRDVPRVAVREKAK